MKKRRGSWARLVVVLSALGAVPAVGSAQTAECEETIAALRTARATIRYADELTDPGILGRLFKPKESARKFPCRGVSEVQFIVGDEANAMALSALAKVVQLESPEQITLIVHRFDASRFDDLANQAETLKKLKAIDLAARRFLSTGCDRRRDAATKQRRTAVLRGVRNLFRTCRA